MAIRGKKFLAMKSVYSYYAPESRRLVDMVCKRYPHAVFLRWTRLPNGLDEWHVPIFRKLIQFYGESVRGLREFPHQYPTAGSEEGIREFMTYLATSGVRSVYILEGDYEGYKEVAASRGLEARFVRADENPHRLEAGYWFLSNPSARDGRLLPDSLVWDICEAGHKVFYDLAYLGATDPAVLEVDHPNIVAVVHSLSKPYGLFSYRIGFMFSRVAVPSLYANKWFKNIFGLLIANALFDHFGADSYSAIYKPVQQDIIMGINNSFDLGLRASDAFLLAYLPEAETKQLDAAQRELIEPFRRHDGYRFCLTKYFENRERNQRNRCIR